MDAEKKVQDAPPDLIGDLFGGMTEPQKLRLRLLTSIAAIALLGWFGWNQYNKSFSAVEGTSPRSWVVKVHKRSGWYDPGISLPNVGGTLNFRTDTCVVVSVGGQEYVINPGQNPLVLSSVPEHADIEFKLSIDAHQEIGRVNMEVF